MTRHGATTSPLPGPSAFAADPALALVNADMESWLEANREEDQEGDPEEEEDKD